MENTSQQYFPLVTISKSIYQPHIYSSDVLRGQNNLSLSNLSEIHLCIAQSYTPERKNMRPIYHSQTCLSS